MKTFHKYLRIWLCLIRNSFKTQMSTSFASLGYLIGKFIRFGFFLFYLLAIFERLPGLKGYSMPEIVLFFMTFNFVDVGGQFLFRGLYSVKVLIEEGDFDKILTQPANPLFRISVMGMDLLDLLTLFPIVGVSIWAVHKLPYPIHFGDIALFLVLLVNALVIAFSFHVLIGALSVKTQELEGAIWVYRDVMTLGRFPINVYSEVIRGLFVTMVPVGIMITFPTRALLGHLSWSLAAYSFAIGVFFYVGSQLYWRRMLHEYTSISS
jgi:ABC-2 type transport system permease protein